MYPQNNKAPQPYMTGPQQTPQNQQSLESKDGGRNRVVPGQPPKQQAQSPFPPAKVQKPKEKIDVWEKSLDALETLLDVIKVVSLFSGLILASLMDVIMGGVAMSVLFGNNVEQFGVNSYFFGIAFSTTFAAIQIYFWAIVRNWLKTGKPVNKMSKDVVAALVLGGFIWLIDTIMDVSPVFLMVGNSQFQEIPILYDTISIIALIATFLVCGFAEILTTSVRDILLTVSKNK